jgi:hypothetical protein
VIKSFCFFIVLLLTAGCAPSIGNYTEEQIIYKEDTLLIGYQEAYRNFISGLRHCKELGVPEGNLFYDIKEGHIDLYVASVDGSTRATGFPQGTIIFRELTSGKTMAKYHLIPRVYYFFDTETMLRHWQRISLGEKVCK